MRESRRYRASGTLRRGGLLPSSHSTIGPSSNVTPGLALVLLLLIIFLAALVLVASRSHEALLDLLPKPLSSPQKQQLGFPLSQGPMPSPLPAPLAPTPSASPHLPPAVGPPSRLSLDTVFPAAALVVVYSESRRSLLSTLANWAANAWWMTRYELVVFYVEGKADPADLAAFAGLAPLWKITLLPFSYDPAWQSEAYQGGGGGGAYINWLLAHEMYFTVPYLARFDYFLRMDDDISFTRPSVGDPFLELSASGALIGWKQLIPDNDAALSSPLFSRAVEFGKGFAGLGDVWPLVSAHENRGPNKINDWRPYLVAGCVEIYHTSVFRKPEYKAYLAAVGASDLLRERAVWEQEVKTMWMQLSVPAAKWKCIACLLPLTHKGEREHDNTWFVNDQCDFERGVLTGIPQGNRGDCGLDPQMRFC